MRTTDYNRENYYSVTLRLPKGSKDILQELASKERRSMTNLFVYALEQQYNVDLSTSKK